MEVLLVEDSPEVSLITVEYLTELGHQVVAVPDAELAVEQVARKTFDAVMTDVSLPGMSGIDLARNILALKPRLPIIIASGYALDFGLENWGSNVRAIIKPFEAPEIEALISDLVPS